MPMCWPTDFEPGLSGFRCGSRRRGRLKPVRANRLVRRDRPGASHGGVQMLGRGAGGGSLRGVLLGLAQFGDGARQRHQAGNQRGRGEHHVPGAASEHAQQPGGDTQLVSGAGAARQAAVRCTGGTVVGIGSTAQRRARQHPRRRAQAIGRSPGSVRSASRVGAGAAADVLAGSGGPIGGVGVDRGAFRSSEPWRSGTLRKPGRP